MGNLTDTILGGQSEAVATDTAPTLTDTVLSTPTAKLPEVVKQYDVATEAAESRFGFVQGLKDILGGVGNLVAQDRATKADLFLPEKYAAPIRQAADAIQNQNKSDTEAYDAANPKSDQVLPTAAEGARMVGQVIGSAPLMPMRAFNAVSSGMRALPTVTAAGEKLAAPMVNRLGASAATGALGGGEFGALTAGTNDDGLLKNMGTGIITGALVGPALTTVSDVAQKTLPTIKNMWANIQINKLASDAGMEPAAVKNILGILVNAGMTPVEAQARLNQMGPKATLSDLAQSIQTEASGLASFGGKPTEILKSRYEARSQGANSEASQIMESKLGPKPNIDAEKENIVNQVRKDVDPDYKAAKESGAVLDISPVVQNIDDQLKTAVGGKAKALQEVKSYFYNSDGKLKTSVADLHEVREAIDEALASKNPATTYGNITKNSVTDIRSGVDAQLKTVPEMQAADNKFASKMQIVNDIDFGNNALKNGMNKEEFAKYYDGVSPERQAAIQKGLRAAIGDQMEKASRGELSEAQRLFGKNSANRANLEKVFGQNGTDALDALQNEAMLRGTEQKVIHGAQTAERQAVQRKYGERNDGPGAGQIVQGAMLDAVTGTPGAATAIITAKRIAGHVKLQMSQGSRERLVEGTSDLISRQGADRDIGLTVANQAAKINNRISSNRLPTVNLPTYLLSAPIGEGGYSAYKKLGKE